MANATPLRDRLIAQAGYWEDEAKSSDGDYYSDWVTEPARDTAQLLREAVDSIRRLADEWRARADEGWDKATLSPDEIEMLRAHADELDPRT